MTSTSTASDGFYVTIGIGREVFAVPVAMVLEILPIQEVFRIPDAPAHLDGLIDVRGRGVAVIDLRTRLGLPRVEPDETTRIVVLDVPLPGRRLAVGLTADRVFEVATLDDGRLEPPPDIGTPWAHDHILGVGRHGGGFVAVLDIVRLFTTDPAMTTAERAMPAAGGLVPPVAAQAA
ncbi:chemotaxis protein CheW [Rhodoplanes roseus]|uniref:Chemotaxis protein CheW n=1 Tax=Rhodoplanes roseus TaxID=29409 RepID=A0A327KPV9_9BRAD|nr:chemotaxis protein CheW [Rhodoplanes roseus]RAI39926.1 chemotaxis protein CheW [Rhodoplanes roseus]